MTNVHTKDIVKLWGKTIKIYEGVINREIFKTAPFRKAEEILINLSLKYQDEGNDIMQKLVKLLRNTFYGEDIGKIITEDYKCKPDYWMSTEYVERVLD